MLGDLYIEVTVASAIGIWLERIGLADNLEEANVLTSGTVE